MFDLNFDKIDQYNFSMKYVALANLFAAWYMLSSLKSAMPNVDTTLAKIYLSEYGISTEGLTEKDVAELAKEYYKPILKFFMRCQVQRCVNIIERFGKVGCDNRLPHDISLPPQCKQFFLEILSLNSSTKMENSHTKETQCLDSLLDTMQVNNTFDVTSNLQGAAKGSLDKDYHITPEQFSAYTEIVNNAVIDLYRPLNGLDETFEDWGTKFRKIVDYIKTLVFMVTRDVAFGDHILYLESGRYGDDLIDSRVAFKSPFVELGIKDQLFEHATAMMKRAYYEKGMAASIQSVVAPYSSLHIEHAICLFHNTNVEINVSKLPQTRNSDTFKFLCCQEYINYLDEKIRKEMLTRLNR